MADAYTLPLIFAKDEKAPVDEDLSLALVFWSLESEREKGGGFIRKKSPEIVTQISIVHRPLLTLKYGDKRVVFDGCGIYSTKFKYGVAPSLTHLPNYLMSDTWASKPELYAEGLNSHSQEFEQAHEEHLHEVRGLVTDTELLNEISELLKVTIASASSPNPLPQSIDFVKARDTLAELDKLKHLLHSEVMPLNNIKQKLNERTSVVLAPLKRECSGIEDKYNREIERVRPSVLEKKKTYEDERMNLRRQIENRFSGRLHDLRNKRDAAAAKIDAYDPYDDTSREPRGGIDRQYSIKESAERRIKELEEEQEERVATVDEKYDALIDEQQKRIDSLEEKKQSALEEPKKKMEAVNRATNRLRKAIDNLIESHESVTSKGLTSNITPPPHMEAIEFMTYVPTVIAEFNDGTKSRTRFLTVSPLKDGKGLFGSLKGLVGVKFMPLEQPHESLTKFATSVTENPKVNAAVSILAKRNNLLQDPNTKNLISSGIAMMQKRGWLKEKEAIEFRRVIDENFVPPDSRGPSLQVEHEETAQTYETKQEQPQLVRFVDYQGIEKLVRIDELEAMRKEDEDQFGSNIKTLSEENRNVEEKGDLLELVVQAIQDFTPSRRYHNEFPYQAELQGWLRSKFPMSRIEIQTGASRPDIVIEDIAIEVKGPTDNAALNTLTTKCLKYSEYYNKIILTLFEPVFSESNFREIESGIERHFPHVRVVRKDEV